MCPPAVTRETDSISFGNHRVFTGPEPVYRLSPGGRAPTAYVFAECRRRFPLPSALQESKFKLTGETGSYRYMAPEVFRHEPYNYKARICQIPNCSAFTRAQAAHQQCLPSACRQWKPARELDCQRQR